MGFEVIDLVEILDQLEIEYNKKNNKILFYFFSQSHSG